MQTLLDIHPMFLVLLAGVAIFVCCTLANTLQQGHRDRMEQTAERASKQRRLEDKRRRREEEALLEVQRTQDRDEQRERRQAEEERKRAESESIYLPRFEESCRLLDRLGTFSLILECLRASNHCLSHENLKRLFKEHRETILKTAVKLCISTKNPPAVKSDLNLLLTLLNQRNELAPLLLDCDRDVLLQSRPVEDIGEFNSQMKALIERKDKKVEAIQQASIEVVDKERLIEELEMAFSDDIAKLVRDCRE